MPSNAPTADQHAAVLDRLQEISDILDTGLDREKITLIKALCEQGVNPQALAQVIKFLRREGRVSAEQ